MSGPDLQKIPGIKLGEDGPVFKEPWEASAFSLVVGLHQKGMFEWSEWTDVLSKTIHEDEAGASYYMLWLKALERIISEKQLLKNEEISIREADWKNALLSTPHGQPIELKNHSNRL